MAGNSNQYLQEHLDEVRCRIKTYSSCQLPEASELIAMVARREGKLVRPSLVLLSGLCLGDLNGDHYTMAAVIEMFHIASLVHDDVLDGADTRRHAPSVNHLFGNKSAVLLGDLLVACAVKAASGISRHDTPDAVIDVVSKTCEGELAQQRNCGNFRLSQEQYLQIISFKTAALIASCMSQGFRLAGADKPMCDSAHSVGLKFGMAFQIMDDVRDIVTPVDQSGKTVGTDFLQGKLTLPLIHHISCAGESAIEFISDNVSNDYSPDLQIQLIARLNSTASLEYARNMAATYMQSVNYFINDMPGKEAVYAFSELIENILS